jgi:phage tail sheath protein FI
MPNYRAPGVYVQEVPSGPRPIGQVGTSTAAFVGVAPDQGARVDETVVLDNWTQFVDAYVGEATHGTPLANAVYGFFNNGGGRCYVVNIGTGDSLTGTAAHPTGLRNFEAIDDIAIVAAPGYVDVEAHAALLEHCEHPLRQDRVAILDTPEDVGADIGALTRVATSGAPARSGASGGGAGAAPAGGADDADDAATDADGGGAGGAAAAPTSTRTAQPDDAQGPPQSPGGYAAAYAPWIVVADAVTGEKVTQPPSGHIAGVWARVDGSRGVHKAPANEPINGALDLTRRISRGEQEVLNPAGINCIRYFPGEGIRIWGARTRAPEASEFRYINVRRLTNMIKESIEEGSRWAVFEPNKDELWRSLRRDIGDFLTNVWRDGALFGTTPEQAFFVKCDAETNPPEVRDSGRLVTIVGLAPVKPAEFIIFKLMQSVDTTEIENLGV